MASSPTPGFNFLTGWRHFASTIQSLYPHNHGSCFFQREAFPGAFRSHIQNVLFSRDCVWDRKKGRRKGGGERKRERVGLKVTLVGDLSLWLKSASEDLFVIVSVLITGMGRGPWIVIAEQQGEWGGDLMCCPFPFHLLAHPLQPF